MYAERVKEGQRVRVIERQLPLVEVCENANFPYSPCHLQLLLLGVMTCQVLSISMVEAP